MKVEDARKICYKCSCFQIITYPNGDTGIGCGAAGIDYPPTDVVTLPRCPKGRDTKAHVDRMDLLKVLGRIFAETCVSPAKISLCKMFEVGHPSIRGRHRFPKLLVEEKIVKVAKVSGVHRWYKWNTSAPSLEMVDKLCYKLSETSDIIDESSSMSLFQIREGMTDCSTCRCRKLPVCQDIMLALGIDCKKYNLNTLEVHDETCMGRQAED